MKFFTKIIVVLSLGFLAANSAFAAVISNGSSGELRPTSDFTLDLSGSTAPQFSSIFIDAGIRLTILTPTSGVAADLLAANDIFVNGIIDAGNGNLNLRAGNQIVLGGSSLVFAGSLDFASSPLLFPGRRSPRDNQSGALIGGNVSISTGGDVSLRSIGGDVSILTGGDVGLLTGTLTSRDNQSGGLIGGDVSISPGGDVSLLPGTLTGTLTSRIAIPEPSSILLLLPGLGLLATRKSWQRKRI